jgi:hypothetical protein
MHPGLHLIEQLLLRQGFRKRAGFAFTLEIASDFLGWIGLNTASHPRPVGEMLLNPVVGVRSQVVEMDVAMARGVKFHSYIPPSISTPLRYLMPEGNRVDWILVGEAGSDSEVAESVVRAISGYGIPYFNQHVSLGALSSVLGEKWMRDEQATERWPVALWRMGKVDEALKAVDEILSAAAGRDDPAARELRLFMGRLVAAIRAGG